MTIREKYNQFVAKYGHEPSFANCSVLFKDGESYESINIKLSCDCDQYDDLIFYYCNGLQALENLKEEGAGEDFVIIADSVEFIDEL